jgi:hypothetical protein
MTLQPLQPSSPLHLTSDQMSDLLAAPAETDLRAAQAHLRTCVPCAAEFASLREALSLFQETSIAHADREFGRLRYQHRTTYSMLSAHRPHSKTLFWVAACAIVMAGILPLELRWQRTVSAPPAVVGVASAHTPESDEALLDDINREISVSVPASMQALANPTGSTDSADTVDDADSSTGSSIPTATEKKD